MVCYIDVQYPPTIVAENDEYEENFEAGCWYSEEIKRYEFFGMILQERSPGFIAAHGAVLLSY